MLKKIAKDRHVGWDEAVKEAKKFTKEVKANWEIASKYDEIIYLRFPVGGGVELEKESSNNLKNLNIFDDVLKNVVILDKDCKHKIGADIYAVEKKVLDYSMILYLNAKVERIRYKSF